MLQEQMIINGLKPYLPKVKNWINDLLQQCSSLTRPISTFNFQRLSKYYSSDIINYAKIVIVNKMPQIPLASMGLPQFGHFENLDAAGVTYLDTVFVRTDYREAEWLYFHELVHILQWKVFGYDDFLLAYGLGLSQHRDDYSKTPFEVMAYENDSIFQRTSIPFDVESKLIPQIESMKQRMFGSIK